MSDVPNAEEKPPEIVHVRRVTWFDEIMRGWSTVVLTALLAVAGWTALQAFDLVDSVHKLEAIIPVDLASLGSRIDRLEKSEDSQNERLNRALDGKTN